MISGAARMTTASGHGGSMRSVKNLATALIAGAALVGSAIPLPAAAADSEQGSTTDGVNALSTFPEFASLPDSAKIDAPLVLHGTVEQLTGAVMPGSHVLLWAWPTNDSVRDLPIGGELELTPIARTVADDSGKYELRAAVTDLLRSLASTDGIDIEVDVFHGDLHYTYLSQVTPTADGKWVRELTGLAEPVGQAVEEASNLLDLTLDRTKALAEQGLGLSAEAPVARTYRKPVPPGCTPFEKISTHRVFETVATAIARGGATAEVVYAQDARTESSTGASIGGAFAINGSRSRMFGFEAELDPLTSTPTKAVDAEYKVQMDHAVFRRSCAKDFRGNEDVLFVTSPLGGATGGVDVIPSSQPTWKCSASDRRSVPARGATRVKAAKATAAAYAGAFSFEPIPGSGFSGSALSGYTKSVSVAFSFEGIDRNKRYWCGQTATPLERGQRLQGFVQ